MKMPAVSICVPVYNVEETLARCLDSLISQTLKNIEIICVNDGSTDGSDEILKKYAAKDNRILVVNKENGGLPSARNAAIELAKGEYLGFVDSDDYVKPNMFKKLYEIAKRKSAEIVICGAEIFPEEPKADQWYYDALSPVGRYYAEFDGDILFSDIDTTPFLWRTLISKELIERNGLRLDPTVQLGEDKAFQAKVYPLAQGICVIPDKLYYYCWHREGSIMEGETRNVSDKKGYMHAKMITSIAEASRFDNKTKLAFFEWAIPFLYMDYMAVSEKKRIETASRLIEAFDKAGLSEIEYALNEGTKNKLSFFLSQTEIEEASKPDVSVILIADDDDNLLVTKIQDSLEQKDIRIEIIVINNGVDSYKWNLLEKAVCKEHNIRIFNTPKHYSFAECIHAGGLLAEGKYTHFMLEDGRYTDESALQAWFEYSNAMNLEMCGYLGAGVSGSRLLRNSVSSNLLIQDDNKEQMAGLNLENVLFRTMFLKEQIQRITPVSILTGKIFVTESAEYARKVGTIQRYCYMSQKKWHKDWLPTNVIEELLETMLLKVQEALEKNNYMLVTALYNMLGSNEISQMIINGTKMYIASSNIESGWKGSQYRTVYILYELMSLVPVEELDKEGYRLNINIMSLLPQMILERNEFLNALNL